MWANHHILFLHYLRRTQQNEENARFFQISEKEDLLIMNA